MADVTVITFLTDTELAATEIPLWRGAVIKMAGADNVLFHDHEGTGLRYSYPLIQYKTIDGRAAVVAVAGGTDSVGTILRGLPGDIRIGRRRVFMSVSDMKHSVTDVCVDSELHQYCMSGWLPLNQLNYKKYMESEGLAVRCGMLERLLVGNILSFAKGLGIFLDGNVFVEILDIRNQKQYKYKGVMMLGMDIRFRANVLLPQYVGLGKGVSLGFGTITEKQ